jgi:hypothetical protein
MKKLFSLFLAAVTALSLVTAAGAQEFTTADALTVLRAAAGLITLNAEQTARYDLDGDGRITTADALMILRVVAGISEAAPMINTRGNTAGNISNGGMAASQGDWIYYSDTSTSAYANYLNGIYRIHFDGTENERLTDSYAVSLNVVGDWIYFRGERGIFRIRTDGTNLTKLSDTYDITVNVVGNRIYYVNSSDNHIYSMYIDGTDGVVYGNIHNVSGINVVGDRIYFRTERNIYRVRPDGTEAAKIIDASQLMMISDGDWIYYMTRGEEENFGIYKVRTDGTENIKIISGLMNTFNIDGDWIYYSEGNRLNKVRTDGTQNTLIIEKPDNVSVTSICIIGDWLFYYTLDAGVLGGRSSFYRIRTDGTRHEIIS